MPHDRIEAISRHDNDEILDPVVLWWKRWNAYWHILVGTAAFVFLAGSIWTQYQTINPRLTVVEQSMEASKVDRASILTELRLMNQHLQHIDERLDGGTHR